MRLKTLTIVGTSIALRGPSYVSIHLKAHFAWIGTGRCRELVVKSTFLVSRHQHGIRALMWSLGRRPGLAGTIIVY